MSKNTSIILGDHFDRCISQQVTAGHYDSAGEILREGLRMVEEKEAKRQALRETLIEDKPDPMII